MESNKLFLASPGTDFNTGRVSIGGYLSSGTKESNELFLASPGTDFNTGCVSIGGYLPNGTKQSNLTVNNYTGMVGIGTTTPTSKLESNWYNHCKLYSEKRWHIFTIPNGGRFNFIISVVEYEFCKYDV